MTDDVPKMLREIASQLVDERQTVQEVFSILKDYCERMEVYLPKILNPDNKEMYKPIRSIHKKAKALLNRVEPS